MDSQTDLLGCDVVYRAINSSDIGNGFDVPENCVEIISRDLITIVKNQQDKIQSMSAHIDSLELRLGASNASHSELNAKIEQSYSSRFDTLTTLQESHREHIDVMFQSQLDTYDSWITTIGILIALAGLITFFFINQYKKREIDKLIDDTNEKIKKDIEEKEIIKQMVVNAFSTQEVQSELSDISFNAWRDAEPLFKSMIDDYMASMNGESAQKLRVLDSITRPGKKEESDE